METSNTQNTSIPSHLGHEAIEWMQKDPPNRLFVPSDRSRTLTKALFQALCAKQEQPSSLPGPFSDPSLLSPKESLFVNQRKLSGLAWAQELFTLFDSAEGSLSYNDLERGLGSIAENFIARSKPIQNRANAFVLIKISEANSLFDDTPIAGLSIQALEAARHRLQVQPLTIDGLEVLPPSSAPHFASSSSSSSPTASSYLSSSPPSSTLLGNVPPRPPQHTPQRSKLLRSDSMMEEDAIRLPLKSFKMSDDTHAASLGCFLGIFKGSKMIYAESVLSEEGQDFEKFINFFGLFSYHDEFLTRKDVLNRFENLGSNFIRRDKLCQDIANQYICGKIKRALQVINGNDSGSSTPCLSSSPRDGSISSSLELFSQGTEDHPIQQREYVQQYENGSFHTYTPPNGESRGCRVQILSYDSTTNTYVVLKLPRNPQTNSDSSSSSSSSTSSTSIIASVTSSTSADDASGHAVNPTGVTISNVAPYSLSEDEVTIRIKESLLLQDLYKTVGGSFPTLTERHIPVPWDSDYHLVFGSYKLGDRNCPRRFWFTVADYGIRFDKFLTAPDFVSDPSLVTNCASAQETWRCMFLHLGVALRHHPYDLMLKFRQYARDLQDSFPEDEEEDNIMMALFGPSINTITNPNVQVDLNSLLAIWPEEFNNVRILLVSFDANENSSNLNPFKSIACYTPQNGRYDSNGNWMGEDIILRLIGEHFTILIPDREKTTSEMMKEMSKGGGIPDPTLLPQWSPHPIDSIKESIRSWNASNPSDPINLDEYHCPWNPGD